jgi:hypothetical protein
MSHGGSGCWIGFNGSRRLAQVALGTTAQHSEERDLAALCGAGRLCMACSADERKANELQH